MHEGGAATHKNPGTEVWVYDATTRRRVTRAPLEHPATSIAFSRDAQPLMYTVNIEHGRLDVYDGTSYRYLRSIDQLGASPTAIQVP
jgi:methylamine dehydrogenase heavy chain